MRKIYFFFTLCLLALNGKAQVINFPDANFKAKILQSAPSNYIAKNLAGQYFKVDANNNGEIEVDEALQVSFLNVGGANITSLGQIDNFVNLIAFHCSNNSISDLNVNNLLNLEELGCSSNLLTVLNLDGLVNLTHVTCSQNQLTSLDLSGNPNVIQLTCNENNITSLDVTQMTSLKQLYCKNNNMTSLNVSGLQELYILDCSNNLLANLDVAGLGLMQLNCANNQLSYLNLAGMQFGQLNCSNNLFASLDLSQVINVSNFYCANNQLTELNLTNLTRLQYLDCSNNLITTLNFNNLIPPTGCYEGCAATFILSNNNLQTLFVKSARTDINLTFNGNPNIQYICTNDSQIAYVQSRANNHGYPNCQVNSYCSFTPGGNSYYTIQGNTRYDGTGNGCDASDTNVPNMRFNLSSGTYTGSAIGNSSGSYSIPVVSGNHTMTPALENPSYFNISPATVTVPFPATPSPFVQDFCISANGTHNDLEIVIIPIGLALPGFDVTYKIIVKNNGTSIQSGSLNLFFNDLISDFVNANPATANQSFNNLTWTFSNLEPFETQQIMVTLNLNAPTESPSLNSGDLLSYTATITGQSDETPSNNTFDLHQAVVNSFDPNDKTCLEGATVGPEKIGDYVHYIIRFENTGTANAQNIVVRDMINTAKFDVASLVPLDASHPFVTRIINTNQVEFIFENINLPYDDANNDGYVAFKIKTKSTLAVQNTFSNTAGIYFDYNSPIVTNTFTTVISSLANPDFEFSSYFALYPNPVKDVLTIKSKSEIDVTSISIYNVLGQLVLVVPNAEQVVNVDVSKLNSGTYVAKINSDKGVSAAKFVKE